MTKIDDQRVRDLFVEAANLDESARAAFLDRRCGGDAELRRELESLLEYHEPSTGFLSGSALRDAGLTDQTTIGALAPGTRIGRYIVVRLIGAGGMGMVYEATQDAPRRSVALKLMRPGLVSRDLLRRFEREAQTLALLRHPGIAQVYEAGTEIAQGSATPYLAMELVEGQALTAYASSRSLGVRERLELFEKLCEAVAHAHQRGVVHRDLKPANVLVDAMGQPKVLDFGIARLMEEDAGNTASTRTGQVLGTLAYLSPEQAGGDPSKIDVRADVYALGVILYELLTGRLPLDLTKNSIHEAARLLRDVEPPPLSQTDASLRGDPETITRKAMAKDASRRYQSAAAMAEDVRRHLRHEPILARPPSQVYLLKKFVRRNRTPVAALAAILLALAAGFGATLWQARRVSVQRDVARDEAKTSEQVSTFLSDLLAAADPDQSRGREVTVREAVDTAALKLDPSKVERPEVRAKLHATLGKTYSGLGDYAKSEQHYREAMRLNEQLGRPALMKAVNAASGLSEALRYQDRMKEAEELSRHWLKVAREAQPHDDEMVLYALTSFANALPDDSVECEPLYRETVSLTERVHGTESDDAARAWANLGVWLMSNKGEAEAEQLFKRSLEVRRRLLGSDHPSTLISLSNYCSIFANTDRWSEAAVLMKELLETSTRVLGPRQRVITHRLNNYAQALMRTDRTEEAIAVLKRYVELSRQSDGGPTEETVRRLGLLAHCLIQSEHYDEAEIAAGQAKAAAETLFSPDDDRVTQTWTLYFDLYEAWGKKEEFEVWRKKLRGTKWLPLDHPQAGPP